jgi:alpha/beta hydrolase family protein
VPLTLSSAPDRTSDLNAQFHAARRSGAIGRTVVLVGHSGAGPLLPAIAASLSEEAAGLVFVDAFLPPASGTVRLVPAEYLDELSALATDGVVPPWSRWFGEEVMRDLLPDAAQRAHIEATMPRLPLSFLQTDLHVPVGWDRHPCAYLLLSPQPYAPSAADARARGWPVTEIDRGKHLDAGDPGAVASGRYAVRRRGDAAVRRANLASARNMTRPTIAATKM